MGDGLIFPEIVYFSHVSSLRMRYGVQMRDARRLLVAAYADAGLSSERIRAVREVSTRNLEHFERQIKHEDLPALYLFYRTEAARLRGGLFSFTAQEGLRYANREIIFGLVCQLSEIKLLPSTPLLEGDVAAIRSCIAPAGAHSAADARVKAAPGACAALELNALLREVQPQANASSGALTAARFPQLPPDVQTLLDSDRKHVTTRLLTPDQDGSLGRGRPRG
jgi:hypothetical protein